MPRLSLEYSPYWLTEYRLVTDSIAFDVMEASLRPGA